MTEEEMGYYSRALDEIYRLRAALAYEARVVEAHLGFKSFPKSRRESAEMQVDRMRAAARGGVVRSYSGISGWAYPVAALRSVGAPSTLTRAQWEAEGAE